MLVSLPLRFVQRRCVLLAGLLDVLLVDCLLQDKHLSFLLQSPQLLLQGLNLVINALNLTLQLVFLSVVFFSVFIHFLLHFLVFLQTLLQKLTDLLTVFLQPDRLVLQPLLGLGDFFLSFFLECLHVRFLLNDQTFDPLLSGCKLTEQCLLLVAFLLLPKHKVVRELPKLQLFCFDERLHLLQLGIEQFCLFKLLKIASLDLVLLDLAELGLEAAEVLAQLALLLSLRALGQCEGKEVQFCA